jgi:hypothetical protein
VPPVGRSAEKAVFKAMLDETRTVKERRRIARVFFFVM